MKINIAPELKEKRPEMALGTIQCTITNSPYKHGLWKEIEKVSSEIQAAYTLETIKTNKMVAATREVYLACGKKPGRYRPAAEALMRRIIKGLELYKINTLVDLVNLVSLKTGYSIGGFDASFIEGNVTASIGKENEPYHAIGRGQLNIHQLPVLRDEKGAIGTPTSDEIRTAITAETTQFLMNINGYTGASDLQETIDYTVELLKKYVDADDIKVEIVE